jgi:hypothetical protein
MRPHTPEHMPTPSSPRPAAGAEQQAARAWAGEQLAEARALVDLPALAPPDAILMGATALHNTFTCQPQVGRERAGRLPRAAMLVDCTSVRRACSPRPPLTGARSRARTFTCHARASTHAAWGLAAAHTAGCRAARAGMSRASPRR